MRSENSECRHLDARAGQNALQLVGREMVVLHLISRRWLCRPPRRKQSPCSSGPPATRGARVLELLENLVADLFADFVRRVDVRCGNEQRHALAQIVIRNNRIVDDGRDRVARGMFDHNRGFVDTGLAARERLLLPASRRATGALAWARPVRKEAPSPMRSPNTPKRAAVRNRLFNGVVFGRFFGCGCRLATRPSRALGHFLGRNKHFRRARQSAISE